MRMMKNMKIQDINRLNTIISDKQKEISGKNIITNNEQEILNNLSSISNTINTFNNFKTFNEIKDVFIKNKITTNIYDKYKFSDNNNNKYMYIQIPDI